MLTMPLSDAEIKAFFEDEGQMGLSAATAAKLITEGIEHPSDLAEFDKDTLKQVAENLRKHGDMMDDPDKNAPKGSKIPKVYVLGAKSLKRLLEISELIRFYETIGRRLTAENIMYDPTCKDFTEQWKALKARKSEDDPDVPKITKSLPIIKWTEAFDDFLSRTVGSRTIPLAYVTRDSSAVPAVAPPMEMNKPHSLEHGSVEGDLIARASHNHALFRDDNAKVYYLLEEATRGTPYAASLKPYQRLKDGRSALSSLRKQYAGRDKWEAEIKRQDELLHNRLWKGQSNFTLEKFIAQHRNAYVSMVQCAQHVSFQLPNEHTRVGYLLDAIQTSDAGLQAAIAQIKTDDAPMGKRNNFEDSASYLLPYDPVAKKRQVTGKRDHDSTISDVTAEVSAGFGTKVGVGKTGVHLRWHTKPEYAKLPLDQKKELAEWRKKTEGETGGKGNKGSKKKNGKSGNDGKNPKKDSKGVIAALSQEIVKQMKKKEADDNENDDVDALIMSLQANTSLKSSDQGASKKARIDEKATMQVSTPALKSIIRRVRNNNSDE